MPADSTPAPLLELVGIVKRFGGVTALGGVDFDLRAGEVHALLGENGAGKSTLIRVLAGVHAPDAGRILLRGKPVEIRGVPDAERLGIRVIHQELSLAPNLTVAENIFLGREPCTWGWLRRGRMAEQARALVRSLGLAEIDDVTAPVGRLSMARRQLVEIARALSRDASVLVLDEPTSSLSDAETEALFSTLRSLRAAGCGIVYISHRLEEIRRLADRITVLRDGRSVGTRPAAGVDERELVRWMVDRDIGGYFHRPVRRTGRTVLEARGLRCRGVQGVSFALHEGEVLGIAGLVGSGRTELARGLVGLEKLHAGDILFDGRPIRVRSPRDALDAGIVLVPEDRRREGLVMSQTLAFNVALPWAAEWNRWIFPDRRKRRGIVERAIRAFRVKAADAEASIDRLSGGNQQKALVGRWMERRPRVLILDEPTRGIDVGARDEVFAVLKALVEEGMAVLLISSDLAEVLGASHRIAVYRDGQILRFLEAGDARAEDVMSLLTGAADPGRVAC